jgi:hypothetical protein
MKTKTLFTILTVSVLFFACQKYADATHDLSGSFYYRGRVFYFDDIYGDSRVNTLGTITVKLFNGKDTANFIYTTQADKDGYFLFKNLEEGKQYTILADTIISGVRYTKRDSVSISKSIDSSTLILSASQQSQNGIVYTVKDPSGTGLITNATICLFTSSLLANRDTCEGSNYSLPNTNAIGRSAQFNIPANTYYAVLSYRFGNQIWRSRDTLVLPQSGILKKEKKLQ